MITDAFMTLWSAVALTGSTSYLSTKSYDTKAATTDVTIGEPLEAVIQIDVAADNNGTYKFDVIDDSTAALTSAPVVLASRTIAYSLLTAGSRHTIPLPPGSKTQRYVGLKLTNTGGTVTVTGWIAPINQVAQPKVYPSGWTIQ